MPERTNRISHISKKNLYLKQDSGSTRNGQDTFVVEPYDVTRGHPSKSFEFYLKESLNDFQDERMYSPHKDDAYKYIGVRTHF